MMVYNVFCIILILNKRYTGAITVKIMAATNIKQITAYMFLLLYIDRSYTDRPETQDMEALTLTIKSCSVIIIGMSDEFCDNAECRKFLMYIKDVLHKPVLLVLLGKTKNWQKGELNMAFGTEVGAL